MKFLNMYSNGWGLNEQLYSQQLDDWGYLAFVI